MGGFLQRLCLTALAIFGSCTAVPLTQHHTRDSGSLIDTLAAGQSSLGTYTTRRNGGSNRLDLTFVNNLPGTPELYAYVTGRDTNGAIVMLQSNNQWNHIPSSGSPTPVKITSDVKISLGKGAVTTLAYLPDYISSSRIYVARDELTFATVGDSPSLVEPSVFNAQDPNVNVSYGFVELDYQAGLDVFDISYVDWVGLPLGITVTDSKGANQSIPGLPGTAVKSICQDLKLQAQADGYPWDHLCRKGADNKPLRIWSPAQYVTLNPGTKFHNYFTEYINHVWSHYSQHPLTIATQSGNTALVPANVTCKVHPSTTLLTCSGDNRGYAKPSSARDIFGCNSGPFAIETTDNAVHTAVVPRLCAAFNRGTFLLPGGHVQPSTAILEHQFYPSGAPSNHYSRIVHKWEQQGKGYAFSYDDVYPGNTANPAGLINVDDPVKLTITIGGSGS